MHSATGDSQPKKTPDGCCNVYNTTEKEKQNTIHSEDLINSWLKEAIANLFSNRYQFEVTKI